MRRLSSSKTRCITQLLNVEEQSHALVQKMERVSRDLHFQSRVRASLNPIPEG